MFITADGELSHGGTGFSIGPLVQPVAQASSKKPQTSAKLSYLARYCLFKALATCSTFG
jgi:hypothetical protein